MQVVAEEIDKECKKHGIIIPTLNHSNLEKVQVRKHHKKILGTLTTSETLGSFYVNDGAIPYTARNDMFNGTKIAIDVFSKFGLVVYVGSKEKIQNRIRVLSDHTYSKEMERSR